MRIPLGRTEVIKPRYNYAIDALGSSSRKENGEIRKEIHIDDRPWYQATSWSLRPFILSTLEAITFWTVRADTLKAYKITAAKIQKEELKFDNGREEAIQVDLRLNGILAPFWKSRYWFGTADGVFLRFIGPSGLPGAPEMTIEFRGPDIPFSSAGPEKLTGHPADNDHSH